MPMRPTPYHQDGKGKSQKDAEVADMDDWPVEPYPQGVDDEQWERECGGLRVLDWNSACIEIRYVFEGEDMRVRGSGVLRK